MFLNHPDSLLDLVRLEQAERNRLLEHHPHLIALRQRRPETSYARSTLGLRPRLAHLLRALANRLQPIEGTARPTTTLSADRSLPEMPRPFPTQRLRQRARPHAAAIARRHDTHHLDAA